jgi:deoxycytidine triphosphate deaminase
MLISPKLAIENGWITGIRNPEIQVQPNAIDFTIDSIQYISVASDFMLDDNKKLCRMSDRFTVTESTIGGQQYWAVIGGNTYDITSDIFVKVPEGVVAKLIIRSSFNRNGIFLTSGLYDQGYEGHIGAMLHVEASSGHIQKGMRIGQIEFYEAQSDGQMYAGGWNHKKGTIWTDSSTQPISLPTAMIADLHKELSADLLTNEIGKDGAKSFNEALVDELQKQDSVVNDITDLIDQKIIADLRVVAASKAEAIRSELQFHPAVSQDIKQKYEVVCSPSNNSIEQRVLPSLQDLQQKYENINTTITPEGPKNDIYK